MVFNVLACNRDDHTGQHAYLMDAAGTWRLAPAYDLTFSTGPGGEHYLAVAGEGRSPTRAHVLHLAQTHGLAPARAAQVIDEVATAVADWPAHAQAAGVTASRVEIAARLDRSRGISSLTAVQRADAGDVGAPAARLRFHDGAAVALLGLRGIAIAHAPGIGAQRGTSCKVTGSRRAP
jgi:hypothetical protein